MAMKSTAGFIRTHNLFRRLKKILFENIRFECAARLAGNNEEGLRDVNFVLERLYLCRVGGIENVKIGMVDSFAERFAQNFRTKARPTHAKQEGILRNQHS